jgi:hypothetical protein
MKLTRKTADSRSVGIAADIQVSAAGSFDAPSLNQAKLGSYQHQRGYNGDESSSEAAPTRFRAANPRL